MSTTFRSSRQFAATPAQVFAAISDAERIARWWGPAGFSNRIAEFDFRPGGRWLFDMIGPDGTVYANESVFVTIEPDRLLLLRHLCQPHFQLSITLQAAGDGCELLWEQTLDDDAQAEALRAIIEPANQQNLDRLAAELARAAS
ncbi:SRPBCC domain-containing protein [Vogesella oryzae]|uniref:SRPBCC domain-containing protein n=1 Tax=Vogesella oryzae TaxID=1735285 RepID=UPI001582298E|nr:SRPBCC domain-containing protein [Vogesella oryzae]